MRQHANWIETKLIARKGQQLTGVPGNLPPLQNMVPPGQIS